MISLRNASKKSRYFLLFAGFVFLQNSSYLSWIFNKYVLKRFDCFLVLKTPRTVTIAPVAATPVPTAVETVDNESLGVLLLLLTLLCCC